MKGSPDASANDHEKGFPNLRPILELEGVRFFLAERFGMFLALSDSGAVLSMLTEADQQGVRRFKTHPFRTRLDRWRFLLPYLRQGQLLGDDPLVARRDLNSKRSRIDPVFGWLKSNGEADWAARLLSLADGLRIDASSAGKVLSVRFEPELEVSPSPKRLAWLIRNAERLAPQDGKRWRDYWTRIIENPKRASALGRLDRGVSKGIPKELILEGPSHADCLIECERMIIWVEGKRFDWLSPGTTWDVTRDQLSRNLEACWLVASERNKERRKDYCLLLCHEHPLKHHEESLVAGYRSGKWTGGWPHLGPQQHQEFSGRIGTVTWARIAAAWPGMREVGALSDIAAGP